MKGGTGDIGNLFDPSIHCFMLDLFLSPPQDMINLREIARSHFRRYHTSGEQMGCRQTA